MRVSRTRFSKRRSKRKTEFPIVAVVQKKRKVESIKYLSCAQDQSFRSKSFSMLPKKANNKSEDGSLASSNFAFGKENKSESEKKGASFFPEDSGAGSTRGENAGFLSFAKQKGALVAEQQKQGVSKSFKARSTSLQSVKGKPLKKSRATIDYKNVILLRNLITAEGKILPRRINKFTAKQQRSVQKAIKSARVMSLIPFINKSRPF